MCYFTETFVDKEGIETNMTGEATWAAVKDENGDWKLIHGHGIHEIVE